MGTEQVARLGRVLVATGLLPDAASLDQSHIALWVEGSMRTRAWSGAPAATSW